MWTIFIILLIPLVLGCFYMVLLSVWLVVQRLRNTKPVELAQYPEIGILIPHFNEQPERLLQSLEAVEAQDYARQLSVFLVDDGSTNGIGKVLEGWLSQERRHHYVPIRFEKNNGCKGKAMDATLPHIPESVEALIVVDSDTYLATSSVRKVVERMWQDERCAAVCGFIVPAKTEASLVGALQYFEHIGVYPAVKCAQDTVGFVPIMAGAFVIHRMSAVRKVGGWGRWIVEDIAWTWSALAHGYRTGYAPEAVAYTYCPTTAKALFKQRRRWARGRVEAFRAAWQVSVAKGLLLTPMFLGWAMGLIPPTLFLTPVLAFHFQQWWVFGLIGASVGLYFAMFKLYQARLPDELKKGFGDIARSIFYNTVFELFLWRPNLLGFFDEILGRRKVWLTR